jgi:hypothetical protein
MAAYYLLGTGTFIGEADLDHDTEQLIHSEVLWELQKRGLGMSDALASLVRVVKEMERNYGSN